MVGPPRAGLCLCLFAAALAAAAATAAASDVARPGDPAELAQLLAPRDRPVLLAITAAWCGHCRRLKPAWEEVARDARGLAIVADFDASGGANREHAREAYGMRGFPTILYRPAGEGADFEPYRGGRSAEALRAFLRERGVAVGAPRGGGGADEL